jgi:predicted Fe-Mo cluster-binding NifX family protein
MKVAVTAQGQEPASPMDLRFGRAKWIHVVDTETGAHEVHNNAVQVELPQGAGIQTGQNVAHLGVEAVITGNVGPNAFRALSAAQIKVFLTGPRTVEEAITAFQEGQLQESEQANVEGHWV